MIPKAGQKWRTWASALAVSTVMVSLVVWLCVSRPAPRYSIPENAPEQGASSTPKVQVDPIAMRYVSAYQESRWNDVVNLTGWMQERLLQTFLHTDDTAACSQVREELVRRTRDRTVEENQLRPEGVEDQYIFAPYARVDAVLVDAGDKGLDRPVKSRTWFRVTYTNRQQALRDRNGAPVRSLLVGVNVSADGYVLKAGIIGNIEIKLDSVTYDWE